MTLQLELGAIQDGYVRRALEIVAQKWPVDDTFHTIGASGQPAFQNAWVNLDAPGATARDAKFYRSGERVYLEGAIKTGTIGLVAFTLPSGYRPGPAANRAIPTYSNGAFGAVLIASNGDVTPLVGSNVNFFLDGVSFRVA